LVNTPRAAAAAAIYPRAAVASAAVAAAAAAIGLKFHPKHVTNKNKTKHIMKKSYINVSIYDKTATSQQIVTKMLNKHENYRMES
jgi:hypothetical protein